MTITTCVFDAYGTLFDVAAAARECAAESDHTAFAACWQQVAADWRQKQLQYTWLLALSDAHTDFWTVTKNALDYALEAAGLQDDQDLRRHLLALYWELSAYPEVPQMLATLKSLGLNTAILSNGSPDMLNGAVQSAGIGSQLDDVLSVEDVGIFKPHKSVYEMVTTRFGCTPAEVLFVSSNCWDACCAAGHGFLTTWANRANEPMDRLPWQPQVVLGDLTAIPEIAKAN